MSDKHSCGGTIRPISKDWARCDGCGDDTFPISYSAAGYNEPVMHVGFTGTRHGMTDAQRNRVLVELGRLTSGVFRVVGHHGDCVGADAEFHELLLANWDGAYIVGHIPTNDSDRAFCAFDEARPPLPYMRRNAEIVKAANVMIAAPPTMEPQERGGTWRTIGLARKAKKDLVVVLPDGSVMP